MSTGSDKIIKVAFLSEQSSIWMGGINYFKNLFIALSKVDNPKVIPYILKPSDKKADILLNYAEVLVLNKNVKYKLTKFFSLLTGRNFPKKKYLYNNLKVDVISHSHVVCNKPIISWIPDFQHIHLPEMFDETEINSRNQNFKVKADDSQIIILSSQDALNDFKNFSPENAYKARVVKFVAIIDKDVYEKTDKLKAQLISKFNLPEKYFYVPNQFWRHKNHKVVLESIAILKQRGIDVKIVFTGNTSDYRHPNFFEELMTFVKEKNIEDNIKILGLVEFTDVYYLMRNCISIINPSLFEGWSSTVEEAKSLGKNIILSNINVHKEQNPLAAIYFNPNNPVELADILQEKWLSGKSGPDVELEKIAKEQLEIRIIEFGKSYQNIVLEALQIKNYDNVLI